jgi:hypothetical protein
MLLFNRNVLEVESSSLSFGEGWGEAGLAKMKRRSAGWPVSRTLVIEVLDALQSKRVRGRIELSLRGVRAGLR